MACHYLQVWAKRIKLKNVQISVLAVSKSTRFSDAPVYSEVYLRKGKARVPAAAAAAQEKNLQNHQPQRPMLLPAFLLVLVHCVKTNKMLEFFLSCVLLGSLLWAVSLGVNIFVPFFTSL